MWFSKFFNNRKLYKRFKYLDDEYTIYNRVKWVDIREEYKLLLDSINWERVPRSSLGVYHIFRGYENKEREYKANLSKRDSLKKLRGRLNGTSKY